MLSQTVLLLLKSRLTSSSEIGLTGPAILKLSAFGARLLHKLG